MEGKDNFERNMGIEILIYFIPIFGLFLIWKDRRKLSKNYIYLATGFGILSLLIFINEVIKYNLI